MTKAQLKPANIIYPLPAVMVSCGTNEGEYNIITIAWTGTICSEPPMCHISIRKSRYSYGIIKKNKEFVINLTTNELAFATDWCGIKSGRNVNKFKEMKLTPGKASIVNAPLIMQSPVNIECKVKSITPMGSHDMFISEIVAVQVDEKYIDEKSMEFDLSKANPICYLQGKYFNIGEFIGKAGFSIKK